MGYVVFNSPAYVTQDAVPATGSSSAGASGIGFDLASAPSGGTLEYDSTHSVAADGYDIQVATTTSNAAYVGWQASGNLPVAATSYWFRMSLYLTSDPAVSHEVLWFGDGASRAADIELITTGKIQLRDNAGTSQAVTTNSVPLNTRFRIEGFVTASATAGQISLSLYSTETATSPLETKTTAATLDTLALVNQVRFGLGIGVANCPAFWMGNFAVSVTGPVGPGPCLSQACAGAPSSSGFAVVSKPVGANSVRLQVATNAGFTQGVSYVAAQAPDSYGYVNHVASGLSPATQYYWQLLNTPSGGSETPLTAAAAAWNLVSGQCKTLPPAGSPESFTFAVASCIDSGGNFTGSDDAMNDWTTWNAGFNIFTGDFDYNDPEFTDVPDQIAVIEQQVLVNASPAGALANMMMNAWGFFTRSDHDTGADGGDSDTAWMPYNITAMLETFPWGPLGDTENPKHGLWQSWVVGRVRFINADIRNIDRSPVANADNASKTMLGSTQLAWFEQQLVTPQPLKIVILDTGWMGGGSDTSCGPGWWLYSTERAAILSYIAANAAAVGNLVFIHGDDHCVAVCPGAQNADGGFPVYCAAPMKQTGAAIPNVALTFPSYYNNAGGNCAQYGRVTVTDTGSQISVNFQGWDAIGQVAQVQQTDTFSAPAGGGNVSGLVASVVTTL